MFFYKLTGINLICTSGPSMIHSTVTLHLGCELEHDELPNDSIHICTCFSAIFVFCVRVARLLVWTWDVAYYVCLIDEISVVILLFFFSRWKLSGCLERGVIQAEKLVSAQILFVGFSMATPVGCSAVVLVPLVILFLFWMLLHGVWNLNPVRAL